MANQPFNGDLLPPGAIGGQIDLHPTNPHTLPGDHHVSIYGPGYHLSYDNGQNGAYNIHTTNHNPQPGQDPIQQGNHWPGRK